VWRQGAFSFHPGAVHSWLKWLWVPPQYAHLGALLLAMHTSVGWPNSRQFLHTLFLWLGCMHSALQLLLYMRQVVFSAGMRPGIAKVGSESKVATIATKAPFDLLFSLCSLLRRNLTLVGGVAVLAAICLPRFSRYSCSCWSSVLVLPRSKVGTACTRKEIPDCLSLVVLHVLLVMAEICGNSASMLALMLEAGARGAVVMTILPFLLSRTPIGRASLLLHLVSSSVMIECSLGRVGVMSVWVVLLITRSRSSLG